MILLQAPQSDGMTVNGYNAPPAAVVSCVGSPTQLVRATVIDSLVLNQCCCSVLDPNFNASLLVSLQHVATASRHGYQCCASHMPKAWKVGCVLKCVDVATADAM
jgi:hypothetical protein